MHRPDGPDPEAATDQLVDEICQRLATLYSLVDMSFDDAGPSVGEIRTQAARILDRLLAPAPASAAIARSVARTLWPPPSGRHVPATWWTTPLGALLAGSLDARTSMGPGPRHDSS